MSIRHKFQSAVDDEGMPLGAVKPSNWNDEHEIDGLLGALVALGLASSAIPYLDADQNGGTIPVSDFARQSLLSVASAAALRALLNAAALDSPALVGTPTAPTPSAGDNSTKVATTAYTDRAIAALIASAPGALDTLNELAAALGNDANFASTVTNALALKASSNSPTFTGAPLAPTQSPSDNSTKIATTAYADAAVAVLSAAITTLLAAKAPLASPALTGSPTAPTQTAGDSSTKLATTAFVSNAIVGAAIVPRSKSGLWLSTAGSSSTFGVSAGVMPDSTKTVAMVLPAALSKNTGPWNVGSGTGALDTGTIAINTWYNVFEIIRPDTGVVDACISTAAAPNLTTGNIPTAYTKFNLIGSMKTNASGQWVKFTQLGESILWDQQVQDFASNISTSQVLIPLSVPPGRQVEARIQGLFTNPASGVFALFTSPDQADSAPSATNFSMVTGTAGVNISFDLRVRTDASRQIRTRSTAATTTIWINTYGWVEIPNV